MSNLVKEDLYDKYLSKKSHLLQNNLESKGKLKLDSKEKREEFYELNLNMKDNIGDFFK